MLNKQNRLTKNKHFQYIYKKGQKVYSKSLYLVYAPTKLQPLKVGIVVSNKVGKAVKRNYYKRVLRSLLRQMVPNLKPNFNYIVVAKPEIASLGYCDIIKELDAVFKRGDLLQCK